MVIFASPGVGLVRITPVEMSMAYANLDVKLVSLEKNAVSLRVFIFRLYICLIHAVYIFPVTVYQNTSCNICLIEKQQHLSTEVNLELGLD